MDGRIIYAWSFKKLEGTIKTTTSTSSMSQSQQKKNNLQWKSHVFHRIKMQNSAKYKLHQKRIKQQHHNPL
jgi:hypothetical protein